MLLVTLKCEVRFKKTKCLFLGNSRDDLEQMKTKIADIKETLDTLMNPLPLEEKKQNMEGKIYFFSGSGQTIGQLLWFSFGSVYKFNFLLRG